jgi:tetratricopeptide (TPR) repeat protein
VARLPGDPRGALADFDEALRLNPRYLPALQNKAHVLGEYLNRQADALAVQDRAVAVAPHDARARVGRGVLRARLGKAAEARADAEASLDRDQGPITLYQVGNIYALNSRQVPGERPLALEYLKRALRGGFGLDVVDRDTDYDPIRGEPEFGRIVKAARDLRDRNPMQSAK